MCTASYGVPVPPSYPGPIEPAFPANGMFLSTPRWMFYRGPNQLVLVDDPEASARLAIDVERPAEPLEIGEVLQFKCDDPGQCSGYRVVIVAPDLVPPATPELEVRTLLVEDPDEAGAFSCPDADRLELTIATSDDATETLDIGFVAYIAPTEAEVAALTEPTIAFGFDPGHADVSTIFLGESAGRLRDGSPFLSPDPYCFSIAAFDRAGNLSARSTTTCLDTTDENDPTVVFVEGLDGCGCASGGDGGLGVLLVLALVSGWGRAVRAPRGAMARLRY